MKRAALSFAVLALLLPLAAKDKPGPLTPGKYEDWGDYLDELEIVHPFKCADYQALVIAPVETAGIPVPPEGDKRLPFVRQVLADADYYALSGLLIGLKGSGLKPRKQGAPPPAAAASAPSAPVPADRTLVLSLKVHELNPGSAAARAWGGFGAGHSGALLSGELRDGETGAVLLRFRQERHSSGMVDPNAYEILMAGDLRDTIIDFGRAIAAFK